MSGAAIFDAANSGPEIISLNMTSVLLVYSSLFARWAWVVQPRNTLLCGCHVANIIGQSNQMRRAINHKLSLGEKDEVKALATKAALFSGVTGNLNFSFSHTVYFL